MKVHLGHLIIEDAKIEGRVSLCEIPWYGDLNGIPCGAATAFTILGRTNLFDGYVLNGNSYLCDCPLHDLNREGSIAVEAVPWVTTL